MRCARFLNAIERTRKLEKKILSRNSCRRPRVRAPLCQPPSQDADSISNGEVERLLDRLLRSMRDDERANPADVEAVQSAMTVLASRSRRLQFDRGTTEADVDGETEHKHEHKHARRMS